MPTPRLRGFGTTLAMAWGVGEHWLLAHVGDSRIYLFRDGLLRQLTRDHTVAQELADAGVIEQQQVALHRLRHRLTRLLGDQVQQVVPVIQRLLLEDHDCLLLCTDGLSGMVADADIAHILASGEPAEACWRGWWQRRWPPAARTTSRSSSPAWVSSALPERALPELIDPSGMDLRISDAHQGRNTRRQ